MALGGILNQILQGGLTQNSPSRGRLGNAGNSLNSGGSGMGAIFGELQNALGGSASGRGRGGLADILGSLTGGGAGASGGLGGLGNALGGGNARDSGHSDGRGTAASGFGGLAERATDFLRDKQGGGLGGAARGGALAVLGTLAISALRSAQSGKVQLEANSDGGFDLDPQEAKSLVSEDTEKLVIRAMLAAAKSDGNLDKDELGRIIGKLGDVTADEKQFIMDEINAPLDINAIVSGVQSEGQAAEMYAASLIAINVDTEAEQRYLAELARALRLDNATVAKLHEMTGAPV